MSSKHILIIDSRDREISSQTTTDFSIVLNVKLNNITKVSLKGFQIKLGWYNITSANNVFSIYHPGLNDTYTWTITPGRYNSATLVSLVASYIQGLVQVDDPTFTLTPSIDSYTGLITLEGNQDFDIVNEQSLELVLGYPDTTTLTGTDSYTTTNLPKLNEPTFLKLQIDTIPGSNVVIGDKMNNFTFGIPLNVSESATFNDVLTFNNNEQFEHSLCFRENPINLQSFRVSLRDADDEIIDNHGLDWFVMLEVETEPKREFYTCSCA